VSTVTTKAAVPSVHRRALITWLAVYPSITTAFFVLGPHTAHLPMPVRTLILTAVVVPVVVYLLVPFLLKADAGLGAAFSARRARRGGGA
jgi:antibiotic biosynthesis monooxygenase (ABM) superfamily enzyme